MTLKISGAALGVLTGGPSSLRFDELADVAISTPLTGQYPRYNTSSSEWENEYLNTDIYNYLDTNLLSSGLITLTKASGPETVTIGLAAPTDEIIYGNGTGADSSSFFKYTPSSGQLLVNSGRTTGSGAVVIKAAGSASGIGANTLISSGGVTGAGTGGSASFIGGDAGTTGGSALVRGGAGTTASGTGGTAFLDGGSGGTTGTGGNAAVQGGSTAGAGTGGNVSLSAGTTSGGTDGHIALLTQSTERIRINANGSLSVGATGAETGTTGQVLTSNGSSAPPTWTSATALYGNGFSGGAFGFKNKLINGDFRIAQRGTSQTSHGYGSVDRWRNENSGSTKTASQQVFTPGQTDVPGNPTNFFRTVVSTVAGAGNYVASIQGIENVRTFQNTPSVLSFWAKADASKNIAIEFDQIFGTGVSSAVLAINVTTIALTTSWQKFTIAVSMPSITGKTIGTANDAIQAVFWFDAGSTYNSRTNSLGQQSGTFDIAQVQWEEGSVATPFEQRPVETELALCQRYYERNGTGGEIIWQGYCASGNAYNLTVPFKVSKRVVPTVTLTRVGETGFTTARQMNESSTWGFRLSATCDSTIVSGYYQSYFTADAEL